MLEEEIVSCTPITLVAGRATCGVETIGVYIMAMNMLSVFTTSRERPQVVECMSSMWALGLV